jgi:hypothetical protein
MALIQPRPGAVTIWASDPATKGKLVAFLLTNVDTAIPVKGRIRLDTTQSVSASSTYTPTRNPVQRTVVDNIIREPERLQVTGTLSASPLGLLSTPFGALGSIIRRDLMELTKLRELATKRRPVAVVTVARTYPSMAITAIQETHPGSNKVDLSLSFEEVRIISPLSVSGVLDLQSLLAGSGSESAMGHQGSTAVPEPAAIGGGLG